MPCFLSVPDMNHPEAKVLKSMDLAKAKVLNNFKNMPTMTICLEKLIKCNFKYPILAYNNVS